jgi:transposase
MAAYAIQRSKNWLALFYHRIKSKAGPRKAITATARKIAVIFYKMIRDKVMFTPVSVNGYAEHFKNKQIKKIEKQAKALGLQIIPKFVTFCIKAKSKQRRMKNINTQISALKE